RLVRVREERRIRRHDPGVVEVRRPADRVENVRREREVQHLLDEDAVDDLRRLRVRALPDRVEGCEVRRQRRVLELDRPLEVLLEILARLDRHGRPGYPSYTRRKPSRRRLGLVAIVVSTAMITSTAYRLESSRPADSPMPSATSSTSPRVFSSTPTASAS